MRNLTFFLLALATSLLLTNVVAQNVNQPEIKASIDYGFFDSLKMNALRPALSMFVLNKVMNNTINKQGSGWFYSYDVTATNATVESIDMDWDNTHFLAPSPNNVSSFQLRNLSLTASVYVDAYALRIIHVEGTVRVALTGINVQVDVAFAPNTGATSYYVSIPDASFSFEKISVTHSSYFGSIFTWLASAIANHLAYGKITSTFTNMLTGDISSTLMNLTMNGIKIPFKNFTATIGIPEKPLVHFTPEKNYTTLGFQVSIVNSLTNESSPSFYEEVVTDDRTSGKQFQLMIATNVMNQVGWAVHQLNMLDISIGNSTLANSPIPLTTSGMKILIPQLSATFGENKRIYVEVKSTPQAPKLYVRDGRIIGLLSAEMDFWVDTNSTGEDQGLKNCTTCKLAFCLNNSMILEMNAFNMDRYHLGATILNLELTELHILQGEGYSAQALQNSLNSLIKSMLPTINGKVKDGVAIPLIGFLGLQDINVNVNKNYLALELSFKPIKKA